MVHVSATTVFTLTQALQLVGLAPSLFVVAFMLTLATTNRQAIIPIFYFLALACSFALPLLELYPDASSDPWLRGGVLLGESLLVAFSFLLICQFIMGRVPPWPYWLVLAIPLSGGSMLLYASMISLSESCKNETCPDVDSWRTLYQVFSTCLLFLLLVTYSSRMKKFSSEQPQKKHKYWFITALISLPLLVLAIDLSQLSGHIKPSESLLLETLIKLSFIYLVLTSLFRVFYPNLANEALLAAHGPSFDPALDAPYVERIKQLLEEEKIYREMRLNRAALAEKLGLGEHQLSRIINHYFSKNFNELINGYRIEEAKQRLKNEPAQQVTVIGFEVGFNSIASFNRVFKEKVGMSPSEWRGK